MAGTATATAGSQTATATSAIPAASYTVTRLDDTTASNSGAIDVADYLGSPTWAQMVTAFGQGYAYPPPTGQTTSYRTGDDSYIETNVFGATVRNANSLKVINTLATFTTLNNNNAFGNTNRFTDDAGGSTYANDYVIDHYTGLGIYRQIVAANISWNDAIDAAEASTLLSFSDWFIPNIHQAMSIMSHEDSGTGNLHYFRYSPFNTSTAGNSLISDTGAQHAISTTFPDNTAAAFYLSASSGVISWSSIKTTANLDSWYIRKHY